MKNSNLVLGIDTSNYTTSAAVTGEGGEIIEDLRLPLQVKQGERGLRQSHALFQHIQQLPELLARVLDSPLRGCIRAVAVSEKPRPVEGSYMPVFNAGLQFGSVVAKSLQVPFFRFSHQEGHLAAAVHETALEGAGSYLAWHLSGGTCELLRVEEGEISIVGGSKDISFGQLIDRVGVAMGQAFPCGKAMDEAALASGAALKDKAQREGGAAASETRDNSPAGRSPLKPIPVSGLYFNVSGIETQAQRLFSEKGGENLAFFLFQRIGECLQRVTVEASKTYAERSVLFTGGVSASGFLRSVLEDGCAAAGTAAVFGKASLSSDNAVGISLLGGQALWR